MQAILSNVFDMSLTASWVILAVLAIRFLLRKAPRKYSYALWSAAAFRLCCPVSFASALSLFNLPLPTPAIRQSETVTQLTHPPVQVIPIDPTSPILPQLPVTTPTVTPPAVTPAVNTGSLWLTAAAVLWCVGMAALLVCAAVSYVRLRRQLATAIRLEANVYQAENIRSPFILGFLRPKIYIPYGLDSDALGYVLAHERTHLKRLDHIIKPMAFLLLTVHWFNPLVWLAFFLMSRDMEMSCDEAVLAHQNNIRKAYSTTLLSFAANRRFPAPSPLAFGETGVKRRIRNVLNWKKPNPWVTVMAVLVCAVVLIACAADPEAPADSSIPDDTPSQSTTPDVPALPDPVPAPAEGSYLSARCLYLSPYSSKSYTSDSGYLYQITDNGMVIILRSSGEVAAISPTEWGWKEFPWTEAEWNALFMDSPINTPPSISGYTERLYQPLDNRYCLLKMDGVLWLMETSAQTGDVWSIYALQSEVSDTGEDIQLQLIADSVEEWAVHFDYANERVGYAVTDLDGNGRLELIAAQQGGTGSYTYASFYEVNEDFTGLTKLQYDFPEGSSQPDLMDDETIPMFYSENTGTRTYVFRDWGKSSAYESWTAFWALTLRDGEITTAPIATRITVYHDPGETSTYTDGNGNAITKEEFDNLPFAKYNYTRHDAAIHWILSHRDVSILSLDDDTLLTRLKESYNSFGIVESST